MLFSDIAITYFEYSEIHNKDYVNQYSRYVKHIEPYTKDLSIDDISLNILEKIQKDKKKILAPKTVNHLTQIIGTIYNHAINRDIIKIPNPVRQVKKLVANNERLRYLSIVEIRELLDTVKENNQLYLFVKLALNTGARLYSLTSIKKKDIDFENNIISLKDYKNETFYKGFLQDDTMQLLKDTTKDLKHNDYILLDGTYKSNLDDLISRRMKPILDELFNNELDTKDTQNRVVIHTLRHTFASHLAINNTPIFTIQKLMNHKDIKQTMRYAKLSPESGRDFVNDLYR